MYYSIEHIAGIIKGQWLQKSNNQDEKIEHILLDSRRLIYPATSVFFALQSPRQDGHFFIKELYDKGVRNFIIHHPVDISPLENANLITVENTLTALQELTAFHRFRFSIPVIGITGSNGKTIVKEWLNQLLSDKYHIVRSPKSYNSQIGVPLSVWQLNEQHELAIFEAGISQQGEMERLEKIVKPTIGILTNIGEAHDAGFKNDAEKLTEKLKLFSNCQQLIANQEIITQALQGELQKDNTFLQNIHLFCWSRKGKTWLFIKDERKDDKGTRIIAEHLSNEVSIWVPFVDQASVENAITCWCLLLLLGIEQHVIAEKMMRLEPVSMRLELKKGINNCSIINDSYSADLTSLRIALEFADLQTQHAKKTVILSDFLQTGMPTEELYAKIADVVLQHKIDRLIGIGKAISSCQNLFNVEQKYFFPSTDEFRHHVSEIHFNNELILLKGARAFQFERILTLLEQKIHQTVLEINLNALAHNLQIYKQQLKPHTRIMAMVKAFSYGSGSYEIANLLQFHKSDYLGVAYADEGVELRKAGIRIPIMVMNVGEADFENLVQYQLEPVVYSFRLLHQLETFLNKQGLNQFPVHIEIETGMNRLGFPVETIEKLVERIQSPLFKIQSVFSHLAASEDAEQDNFTQHQAILYTKACNTLQQQLPYSFLRHIGNTASVKRHPDLQLDMVRLGIGLYGVDHTPEGILNLQPVSTLKSTIAQIHNIEEGETVSYNRRGVAEKPSKIATVRIGYADGYPRSLSNGNGKMWVNGHFAPVIGIVCMDMTMIDVTEIPDVKEGDEVIVFGQELSVQQLSKWANTIPYEILSGISQRVKRVYFQE